MSNRSGWLKTTCGSCKRIPLLQHFVSNIVRNLQVGDILLVSWRLKGQPLQKWRGVVVEKPTATSAFVDYGAAGGGRIYPLPPVDDNVRLAKLEVAKRWLGVHLKTAQVGHFVTYVFIRNEVRYSLVGVCVSVSENHGSVMVKFFDSGDTFRIPAPRSCDILVLKLRFYPPFVPTRGAVTHSERQRFKRLRKLEVVLRPGGGSSVPPPRTHMPEATAPTVVQSNDPTSRTVQPKNRTTLRLWGPKGIILCTWNCRTLTDRAKIDCLICVLHSRCVHLAALQETRRTTESPQVDVPGWLFCESVLPGTSAQAGVGILISPQLAPAFVSTHVIVPGRVIAVKLQRLTVLSVYMPTFTAPDERQFVFDAISNFVSDLPRRDLLVMLGDFNSRQLNQVTRRNQPLYRAAQEFQDFLQSEDLFTQLVLAKDPVIQKTHKQATLDYALLPNRQRHALKNYNTSYLPVQSDHKLLSIRLCYRTPKLDKNATPPQPRPDFKALRTDPELRHTFVSAFKGVTTYGDFVGAYRIAKELLPSQLRATLQPSYKADLVKALVMMEARLRDHDTMLSAADAHYTSEVERLVGMYTKLLLKDPRLAWTHISALRPQNRKTLPAPNNKERISRFTGHFKTLYGSQPDTDDVLLERIFRPHDRNFPFDTGSISIAEITNALESVKSNKAAGHDEIPNEVLRLPELRVPLLYILNSMFHSAVPQELRTSLLVPLPKKGDISLLTNWRGISLMPHMSKLFNRILLNRLLPHIDPQLNWGQNGFRPERNTAGHIMCVTALCDIARSRKGFPLHGTYVDFSKAFDSITWKAIELALRRWNVPDCLIACILKIMHGHQLRVRVDGITSEEAIDVTLGVLQGDTLAPFLFVIVVDAILCALPHVGLKIGPTELSSEQGAFILNVLGFADDLILLAHTPEHAQLLFRSLQELALACGLRINFGEGKTERFHISTPPGEVSDRTGKPVPVVSHYKYLGVFATDPWKDLTKRSQKCWAALQSLKSVWKSNLDLKWKRNLFYALVEPIWTYGIGAWPLTRAYEDALNGTFGRMLRFALGLKPAYVSRHTIHTEQLYGDKPFITTVIRTRRMNFIAHHLRATCTERIAHPFIQVLFWEVSPDVYGRRRGGQRVTLQASLLRDAHYEYMEQLIPILGKQASTAKLIEQIRTEQQTLAWQRIHARREAALDNRTIASIYRAHRRAQQPVNAASAVRQNLEAPAA